MRDVDRLDSSLISSVPLVSCDNLSGYPCYLRRTDQWSIDVLHSFLAAGLKQTVDLFIDEESEGGESRGSSVISILHGVLVSPLHILTRSSCGTPQPGVGEAAVSLKRRTVEAMPCELSAWRPI